MDSFVSEGFYNEFVGDSLKRWVRNVETSLVWVQGGTVRWPITRNSEELDSSYVVSPYAALILYSRQEIMAKLPKVLHVLLLLLAPLSLMLKRMRINDHLAFNNWLLSTNLYPPDQEDAIIATANEIIRKNPDSFLILRSLNELTNARLIQRLKREGYYFLPSRQVYFFDFKNGEIEARHNFVVDQKLLEKSLLQTVGGADFSDEDFVRAEQLYSLLYLKKYSEFNPAFTADYLKLAQRTGVLKLYGFRYQHEPLIGVVGFFIAGGVLTAPIVGYDTERPAREALYRHVIAFTLRYAKKEGFLVNLSSGASGFKRLRGGVPITEWSAVYCRDLSLGRRLGFHILQLLLNLIALPLLKVLKL